MNEPPRQPIEEREVVERRERVSRGPSRTSPDAVRSRRSNAWLWVVLLAVVVGALAWYALSRGEPAQIEVPELEAPAIDLPEDEPNIEINVGDDGGGEGA